MGAFQVGLLRKVRREVTCFYQAEESFSPKASASQWKHPALELLGLLACLCGKWCILMDVHQETAPCMQTYLVHAQDDHELPEDVNKIQEKIHAVPGTKRKRLYIKLYPKITNGRLCQSLFSALLLYS